MATIVSQRHPDDPARRLEADSLFRASIEMARALPPQPGAVMFRLNAYGRALRGWNRLNEAEAVLGDASARATSDFGPQHPAALTARGDWGRALVDIGSLERGLEETGTAYGIAVARLAPGDPARISVSLSHAHALIGNRRRTEAAALLDELRPAAVEALSEEHGLIDAIDEVRALAAVPERWPA
jgi:hypothetical protein